MVVLDVLFWEKWVSAVIDTGAVVSVCSHKLVRELGITVTPWRANRLVSVDGKEIQPGGAAMLLVSDRRITVEGECLVLEDDIDLLLGKDMLEKLGMRMKIGVLKEIFIGDIAIGALVEEMMEGAPKLVVQKGCWVPPRSMKVVATQPLELKGFGECALRRGNNRTNGDNQLIGPQTMDRRGDGVRNNRASDGNQGGRHASSRRDSRGREESASGARI
ncbi:Uncharacterized protein APZ42_027968 [Daphnia magna]|uniref:Peptidase A2 domain-containing protein n=1 Tax=Daphnia magna TaxID=35525 RepID=A0A164QY64_9CRUS|nr:Uncharacterized protein APZ42_027968 [Daphnia magna]